MSDLTITVVHPGVQHAPQMAEALSLVSRREVKLYSRLVFNGASSPFAARRYPNRRLEGRAATSLTRVNPSGEIAAILARDFLPKPAWHHVNRSLHRRFQDRVLPLILKQRPDVVISFDTASGWLFERLHEEAPDVLRVLDASSTPTEFIVGALVGAAQRFPKWTSTLSQSFELADLLEARREANASDVIVTGGDYCAQAYRALAKTPVIVEPYGSKFTPSPGRDSRSRRDILFCGSPILGKGLPDLLEAWTSIDTTESLHVVGGVPAHDLLDGFDTRRIVFHGRQNKTFIRDLMRSVRGLVLPTYCEGLSLVLCEALRSGCGIITTEQSGIGALIDRDARLQESVSIVSAGDVPSIAEAIANLGSLRQGFGWKLPFCSWENRASAMIASFEGMLSR